jgi:hypothetical protein
VQLILESTRDTWTAGETVTVRVLALNDSYEPVSLDRRLLVGPNAVPGPPLISLEPSSREETENMVLLHPWCFYGRERGFDGLLPGRVNFHAYLMERLEQDLLPDRPRDETVRALSAEPLAVEVRPA